MASSHEIWLIEQMTISVILATHNGAKTLPLTLQSLVELDYPKTKYELIIVDNASTDETTDVLNSFSTKLPLTVMHQPRRGKNASLNLGITAAKGELVILTDDDVLVDSNWISALADCANRQPDIGIYGGVIEAYWLKPPPAWLLSSIPLGVTYALTAPSLVDGPVFPGLIWGPNMMVRKRIFDEGHRFAETIGPSAGQYIMGSETEFNIRVSRSGHKTWFCTKARVRHIVREHQICAEWAINRAYRFGRNKCYQDHNDTGTTADIRALSLLNFPRWMLRKAAQHAVHAQWARLTKDRETYVRHRWDYMFYRGYMYEAQKNRFHISK